MTFVAAACSSVSYNGRLTGGGRGGEGREGQLEGVVPCFQVMAYAAQLYFNSFSKLFYKNYQITRLS